VAAVDEMMRVRLARRVAGAIAGAQQLFAAVGHQRHFAFEHVDELVLRGMPMAQRGLPARWERHEVDAKAREAARVAEAPLGAISHARAKGFGITRAATFGNAGGLEGRQAKVSHDPRSRSTRLDGAAACAAGARIMARR